MDTKGYVVIVDAFAPARFFPPEFHEAGYACVRVQSTLRSRRPSPAPWT